MFGNVTWDPHTAGLPLLAGLSAMLLTGDWNMANTLLFSTFGVGYTRVPPSPPQSRCPLPARHPIVGLCLGPYGGPRQGNRRPVLVALARLASAHTPCICTPASSSSLLSLQVLEGP